MCNTPIGTMLLVIRSLKQHFLSTFVTVLSVALASGLVVSVFAINYQTYRAFTGGGMGFDAVLGARGSQLQLVLNAIFHLETSPGNIPWRLYETIKADPRVLAAIPYATGDNYLGFRMVGTKPDIFTALNTDRSEPVKLKNGGRLFDEQRREAVIGSFVARKTGLTLGSVFNPYHGLNYDESQRHAEEYVVVGIMEPTNSPADRVIFIPIEGIFRLGGHVLRGSGEEYQPESGKDIPDEHKEVSAVLLKLKNPQAGFALEQTINRQGKVATLAWPIGKVMADLFEKLGWANRILSFVAYLVMIVAAGSILASLYNTLNERKRDLAILRALGARRTTIFGVIFLEAGTISLLGTILGYFVYLIILSISAAIIQSRTGVVLDLFSFHPVLVWGPLGMFIVGTMAGLLPAWKAYRTDVATNLLPRS